MIAAMNHSRSLRSLVLASFAICLALPALGGNLDFMKDTPLQKFTPEDMKFFRKALDDILDTGKDGDSSNWSNPTTDAAGELKAIKSFERSGTHCRTLKVSNSAKGLSASGNYNFCKPPSTGKWTLAN